MWERRPARISVALGLGTLLIAFAASSGTASAGGTIGMLGAKKASGPYGYVHPLSVGEGKTKVVYWRVINPETTDQEVTLTDGDTDTHAGYRFKWYSGVNPKPSKEITSKVADTASGLDFTLRAGDTRAFSTEVKAKDTSGGVCLEAQAASSTFLSIRTAYFAVNAACA